MFQRCLFAIYLIFVFVPAWGQVKYAEFDPLMFTVDVQVKRDGDKIILHGFTCRELEAEASSITTWSKRVPLEKVDCACSEGRCTLDVTEILPPLVEEKHGVCSAYGGPNCWNGSLVSSGVLKNLRYSNSEEMSFWMSSPLCQERKAGEPKRPGDIIAIRDSDNDEVHGYVYISENLAFSKNGTRKDVPYSLQSPNFVNIVYRVSPGCEAVEGKPAEDKKCTRWANAYSCMSMDEYLEKNPMKSKELIDAWKTLEASECDTSLQVFNSTLDTNLIDLTKTSLRAVSELAQKRMKSTEDPTEKFLWEAVYNRADSSYNQNLIMER